MFELIPFGNRENELFDSFDRMVNRFLGNPSQECFPCRTDILDQGNHFELDADMPGFKKEDISIGVEGDRLILSAVHKEDTKENDKKYIRRERKYGTLSRSFELSGIDTDKISAGYQDGVLKLILPKMEKTKPQQKKVEIQ
jgi:HSP20 family protein